MLNRLWTLSIVRRSVWIAIVSLLIVITYYQLDIAGDMTRRASDVMDYARGHRLQSFLILFVWSSVLFLTVAPLGSVTILVAGFLLGPWAGLVQFLALCLSSWLVHHWTHPGQRQAAYAQILQNAQALRLVERFKNAPMLTVSALRLIPVIPSCVCVLACSALGIAGKHLFYGTLLTGWARPVFFAFIGSQAASLLELLN